VAVARPDGITRYNPLVKTAISIPDDLYEAADQLARRLGMSRSELYSNAVAAFVKTHRGVGVREALEAVYGREASDLDPVLDALQAEALRERW